jgi:hypothetical protein
MVESQEKAEKKIRNISFFFSDITSAPLSAMAVNFENEPGWHLVNAKRNGQLVPMMFIAAAKAVTVLEKDGATRLLQDVPVFGHNENPKLFYYFRQIFRFPKPNEPKRHADEMTPIRKTIHDSLFRTSEEEKKKRILCRQGAWYDTFSFLKADLSKDLGSKYSHSQLR